MSENGPGTAERATGLTVGEVSRLAGVTVRTLHHYDRIGLLRPGGRTAAGYRVYDDDDLARLQQVLAYRELGFGLDGIAALLDDPTGDPMLRLRRQHELVLARLARLREVAAVLERTMEAHAMGIRLTPGEMLEVFGDHDPAEHAAEAEQRWGETDAWKQSQRRTSGYTKADWLRVRDEADAINREFAAAQAAGEPAAGGRARAAAEEHRQHISRWFYDVPYPMHRGLAEMYLADPRFTKTYEDVAPGLARYVHDAIIANAEGR